MTEVIHLASSASAPHYHYGHKARHRLRLVDAIVGLILLAVIVALAITLFHLLQVRNEIIGARGITDRVANDVATIHAADVLQVADPKFKKAHSETQLTALFKQAAVYTKGNRTIDKKIIANSSKADVTSIIYKYTFKGQKPYFIRVTATKTNGPWQLTGLTGTAKESDLVK